MHYKYMCKLIRTKNFTWVFHNVSFLMQLCRQMLKHCGVTTQVLADTQLKQIDAVDIVACTFVE